MRSWKSISFQEPGGCPWLVAVKSYRHFSASALLTAGVKFLLSVSLSSKAAVRHHCQATLLHICTITQDVELRFFQGFQALCCRAGSSALIRVRNHSLLKHLFCGWGTSARCCDFEDVIAEKTSHVLVHGILDVWPWVCCLTPTKISYSFSLLQKVSCWRLLKTNAQYFSKFMLSEIFTTSSAADLQRQKIDNLCIRVQSCPWQLSLMS